MRPESTKGLCGLDDPTIVNRKAKATKSGETKTSTPEPVSPSDKIEAEIEELDELREQVEELQKKHDKEPELKVPIVGNPEDPTEEEVERHNTHHANFKSWCKHCNAGLAQRDQHKSKTKKPSWKSKFKRGKFGEVKVPDAEAPKDGMIKYSMGYNLDR